MREICTLGDKIAKLESTPSSDDRGREDQGVKFFAPEVLALHKALFGTFPNKFRGE